MKLLIIGGVAGGATAAARARRLDEKAQIIVFERGDYVSFANCGLPYHIGGAIPRRESLLLQTPEGFKAKLNIDVRVKHEVISIDRKAKTVRVRAIAAGSEFTESYDKLIIATGSRPMRPPIPGSEFPEVSVLWTINDMDAIIAKLNGGAKSAIVVGAGFIGLELAENLIERGISTTVVEMLPQVMPPLDPEMAQLLAEKLSANGVALKLGAQASSIEKIPNGGLRLFLKDGSQLDAEMIVLCAGVRPNSELAKDAGLELGPRGGIVVDASLRTSDPDIFAVGDAVQVKDLVIDAPAMIPLAGPANSQGRIAADNALGRNEAYEGSIGTSIVKVFDLTAAMSGASEKRLKQAGKDFFKIYLHPFSHVNYFPGAEQMSVKALFDKEGRILGAQIVGRDGVDKRIDVLAAAIKQKLKAADLASLELAYAPPYGAAKDPVNMIGFIAENVLDGTTQLAYPDAIPQDAFLLDVRESDEFAVGSIPRAANIPLGGIRSRLRELPEEKEIIVFCQTGSRSYNAERILRANGFKVKNLSGAYRTWKQFNPPPAATAPMPKPAAQAPSPAAIPLSSCGCPLPIPQQAPAAPTAAGQTKSLDVRGMQCPGPIIAVKNALADMKPGDTLSATASDESFARDLPNWCAATGNSIAGIERKGRDIEVKIVKGGLLAPLPASAPASAAAPSPKRATIVLFSNDLDKAMAAFIIASGYATLGLEVNIFCTFWGLNVLRKGNPPAVKKDILSRMFGLMMPCGAKSLALSKMHMLGMGTAMMKHVMNSKGVDDLPTLIASARQLGVKLLACEMAMNVMGIKEEELVDNVEIVGVATFASLSGEGGPTLFI